MPWGPEEIDQVFAQTLMGDYDDDASGEAVRKLHLTGGREVYAHAAEWCTSDNPLKRARGAYNILGQLGRTIDHGHDFPEECFLAISDLLQREKESLPLLSAIHSLGHIGSVLAVPMIVEHRFHVNADVRFAVACALASFANDKRAAAALLTLTQDSDEDVRDWATFGLGILGELDSEESREALWQRMGDPNRNVREESLAGLSKRQDQRALPKLISESKQPEISDCVIAAAESFLGEDEHTET
jgi:HEAT repeats